MYNGCVENALTLINAFDEIGTPIQVYVQVNGIIVLECEEILPRLLSQRCIY